MKFKTLKAAIKVAKGYESVSVFRYPRGRTFYIGWSHAPEAWNHSGCQVLYSN